MPTIVEINLANAVLELPRPLRLGAMTVKRREYAAVEIVTSDGLRGKAYCLTRDMPMTEIVRISFSEKLIGQEVEEVPRLWDQLYRASAIVGRVGLVRRALGLVDIALWDIESQNHQLSLSSHLAEKLLPPWEQLDDYGQRVIDRALLVAAYPTADQSAREIADEIIGYAGAGWTLLKISRSADTGLMRQLLHILRNELPPECDIVIDVGFGWTNADQALREISQWGEISLAWLEDPLLPEDVDGIARIRQESCLAVGVGDEVTDPNLLHRLADRDAIDVLRLDVVAIGGITPSLELITWAREKSVPVSGHIYPEVTSHLGIGVETFPRYAGPLDPAPSFIRGGPTFSSGEAKASVSPGLGFTLDSQLFSFGRE